MATYQEALAQNPQSSEVATKVKRLTQLVREKKRNQPKANGSSTVPEAAPVSLDAVRVLYEDVHSIACFMVANLLSVGLGEDPSCRNF